MPTKAKTPPWDHIKEHAIAYITTGTIGIIALVGYLGGQALLDTRYLVAADHKSDHSDFITIYQETEAQKAVAEVRKELRQTRSDLRRAQAYLNADPDSPLVNAREQAVMELEDEIEALNEEYELAKKKLNGD